MTNPTADAPVRATRVKTQRPSTDGTHAAPPEPQSVWTQEARPLLREWLKNLYSLNYTVILAETEGPAAKLANLADEAIRNLQAADDELEAWIDSYALHYELSYRVLVLLQAAYRAVDETVGDPTDRVHQAAVLAQAVSWTHLVSETVEKLPASIETLRVVCQGSAIALSQQPATVPRNEKGAACLNGHTPKQIELAFQNIASMAGTLRDHLMEVAGQEGEVNPWTTTIMVTQIGSLADFMSGCDVLGSPAQWSIGDSFRQAGAA